MEIIQLDWDTHFFGYKVGKVIAENELDEEVLKNSDYQLIYIFSKEALPNDVVKKNKLFLADEKVDLIIDISKIPFSKSFNESIIELNELDSNLLDLTFESGHFSRFKVDRNFKNNEFEKLYTAWIEQSIRHENAEKVIGFMIDSKVVGFITICFKNNRYDIGLVAVSKQYRSLKIGKQLLEYIFNYASEKECNYATVTTQKQNEGAMKFYIKNGFSINHTTYIYHLWK